MRTCYRRSQSKVAAPGPAPAGRPGPTRRKLGQVGTPRGLEDSPQPQPAGFLGGSSPAGPGGASTSTSTAGPRGTSDRSRRSRFCHPRSDHHHHETAVKVLALGFPFRSKHLPTWRTRAERRHRRLPEPRDTRATPECTHTHARAHTRGTHTTPHRHTHHTYHKPHTAVHRAYAPQIGR